MAESKNTATETLKQAQQRADRAERELQKLKQEPSNPSEPRSTNTPEKPSGREGGIEALRADSMMAHLLQSLEAGKDIGHYGRLVFTMVASHFLSDDEILNLLQRDRDVDHDKARALLRQVEAHNYNPPRRERILEWQSQQDFPILPNAEDPDCGNVYKSLKFPDEVYDHIQHYQEEKADAEDTTSAA